jgi:hypothetical protein
MEKLASIKELASIEEGKTENPTEFWEKVGDKINNEVVKTTETKTEEEKEEEDG